jgi:hypothetical protein
MATCATCGHQLGVGRFCTHCGAGVDTPADAAAGTGGDWRTDTAERTLPRAAVTTPDPRTPPSAVAPPPPPRYPLYADEVEAYSAQGPLSVPAEPQPQPEPEPTEPAYEEPLLGYEAYSYEEERRSPVLWILVAALVLALVAGGWWFLGRDDSSGRDDTARDQGASAPDEPQGTDVAARADAEAPETAPPNQDVDGHQVSYDASNMLDGVPTTAWRMPGDGTGTVLTFTLPEPVELTQVGLVNGYAKTSTDDQGRTFDWYRGNRRVLAVVWSFGDGTKVRQQLDETQEVQRLDLDEPVQTKTVKLRLVKVSAPGQGDTGRDFTAISEVSLIAAG